MELRGDHCNVKQGVKTEGEGSLLQYMTRPNVSNNEASAV